MRRKTRTQDVCVSFLLPKKHERRSKRTEEAAHDQLGQPIRHPPQMIIILARSRPRHTIKLFRHLHHRGVRVRRLLFWREACRGGREEDDDGCVVEA